MSKDTQKCLYLYGIADSCERPRFGRIGIEGAEPYAIPYKGFTVIAHDCQPEPYSSEDSRIVERWIREHEAVVDVAIEKLGNVIPIRFNTIIKPDGRATARLALRRWISKGYPGLHKKMEKIRGKMEYGIQVFYVLSSMREKIVQKNAKIAKIIGSVYSGSGGLAYIQRLRFEDGIKRELEATVASCYKDFYQRIQREVDEIKVGGVAKAVNGTAMLMNLSVLAKDEQTHVLGSLLDRIEKEGFSVRFTGPWPPYSFV